MKQVKTTNWRQYFPWFKYHKNLVYLDNAATSLKPLAMIKKINWYQTHVNALVTTNPLTKNDDIANVYFKYSKKTIAKFLQANENEVLYSTGSTESLNFIANLLSDQLNSGDEIIVHYMEHGSNLLPWYKLRDQKQIKIVFVGKEEVIPTPHLYAQAVTNKTKIVAFAGASNLLANWVDVKEVVKQVKAINPNIWCVVDATQQLEHFPAYCHKTNCDFLVGSAHKIIGPTGLGFTYISSNAQKRLNFDLKAYEIAHFSDYDMPAIVGFDTSLQLWMKIGYHNIAKHEQKLKEYFLKHVDLSKIILYTPSVNSPLITFNMYNEKHQIIDGQDIEYYLGKKGIFCRSSLSCAKLACYPLHAHSVVRASVMFYNNRSDINKLIKAINEFKPGDELNGLV